MKHLFRFSIMLLTLLLPATANAYDFEVDGIYYNYFNVGNTVEVTYSPNSKGYSGDVTIPPVVTFNGSTYSVTAIGEGAFNRCDNLTSVSIPNSVTTIGYRSFYHSCNLETLIVESGNPNYDSRNNCNAIIETASNKLIAGCQNTVIPNSVITIGDFSFAHCTSLTSIAIPNSVTSIGYYAFISCTGLTSLTIPNSVTSIGDYAFYNCTGLTSLSIPNSVTDIGDYAFYNCSGLTSLTIPNSVTSIGYDALDGTAWYNNQPDGLIYAGLVAYEYKGTMPDGTSVILKDGTLSITDGAFFMCYGMISIAIPNSVIEIGEGAFSDCKGLTSIDIPNSVTTIGTGVFSGCYQLETLIVESGNPNYDSRNNCNAIIETASNKLIAGCQNTVIPNSVITIGEKAFAYCFSLTSLTIPNSVTIIGDEAFCCCWGLTEITIPNSVTSIGENAFDNCSGLTNIDIPNSVTFIGKRAFEDCSGLTSLTIPNSITSISRGTFCNCSGLTSLTIPNSVTTIGRSAFSGCFGLTNVIIPNSVTTIDEEAFYTCAGLTNMIIPNSVISIGSSAFAICSSLTNVSIPSSVTTIGNGAFYWCYALTDVYSYISDLLNVSVGANVFKYDIGETSEDFYSGRTLHVPNGTAASYQADENWYPYFGQIADDLLPNAHGDVNGDLEVNIADVNAVINIILGGNSNTSSGDVNGDGEINIADINSIINIILSGAEN